MTNRIEDLEKQVRLLRSELANANSPLIPRHPLEGIEVIPKKEVVLTETAPEPLSMADRLLLNSSARKALEVEEQDVEPEEVEVEAEEEVEEETEVEAEVEEEEGQELEEFEYKGATYYRDAENNVFMSEEDGEFTHIGTWSEVKKRIIVKKPEA
jgi:hypothetical protein